MDIFIPIGIGFLSNIIVFMISMFIVRNKTKAANVTIIFFGITIVSSLVIGRWEGMGLAVISLGMLLFSLCLYLYIYFQRLVVR